MNNKPGSLLLILSACVSLFGSCLAVLGQTTDSKPKLVTLAARKVVYENGKKMHDNYVDAAFSFEHGVNGEVGKQLTRNDWDLLFGNSPVPDAFDVTIVTDDCSRIKDLGEFNWHDKFEIPQLPAYSKPTREPSVKAVVGHIYLVHTADTETDLYALFRVEALEPGESVTISWKLIPPPEKKAE